MSVTLGALIDRHRWIGVIGHLPPPVLKVTNSRTHSGQRLSRVQSSDAKECTHPQVDPSFTPIPSILGEANWSRVIQDNHIPSFRSTTPFHNPVKALIPFGLQLCTHLVSSSIISSKCILHYRYILMWISSYLCDPSSL
ncbi:unnamed protein product [Protopolystoma xenopodis]|uniref:Uncharacterized protein n=1 Tax=Protopolystoma xenopodis TaxID=117903 RepID=A0A3S5FGP3_9PLAT|nr:unnamed protein product [Protopolystoma xenopodis]